MSRGRSTRPRLAILTNMVAPYRVPLFLELARTFDVVVLVSGAEANRQGWEGWERRLAEQGVPVRRAAGWTLPYRSGGDPRYLHVNPGYLAELERFRPHAVISSEMGPRTLTAYLWTTMRRVPLWVWWEGTPHTERKVGVLRCLVRRMLAARAVRWISAGSLATRYLQSLGVPRERIVEAQNCVDERLFTRSDSVPRLLHLRPGPVLLFAGQFIPRKGLDRLLLAARRVQDEKHRFTLVLAGAGPEEARLRALAEGVREVCWIPPQLYEMMPRLYRSADCFVYPTLEDVWGLAVNEAILSGLPVLCSIYAGCAEDIVPETNRFDPLDMDAFVTKLRACVEGRLAPSDRATLRTVREVAGAIAGDIGRRIGGTRP